MLKKIWNTLGSLTLSFWLLMIVAALFIIGSIYTDVHYSIFKDLSQTRIQDWLLKNFSGDWSGMWWFPLLLTDLFLLGVNTFICTCSRIVTLFSKRTTDSKYRFAITLIPSVIHILFLVVLFGHMITIVFGIWTRILIVPDGIMTIDSSVPALTVKNISNEFYPETSLMKDRIKQTTVTLEESKGKAINLQYLDSIDYYGYKLHLDMIKDKKISVTEGPVKIPDSARTCYKSDLFSIKNRPPHEQKKIFLLAISDPGLPVIITAFSLILILMTWYYIEIVRNRNIKNDFFE